MTVICSSILIRIGNEMKTYTAKKIQLIHYRNCYLTIEKNTNLMS